MPFDNGSFEEGGARTGEPRGWRLVARVRSTEIATFDDARGVEGFAWSSLRRELGAAVVRAVFGTTLAEDLSAWAPGAALAFDDVLAAAAQFDGQPRERFSPGWSSAAFVRAWEAVVAAAADLGAAGVDDFTRDWPGTAPRYLAWSELVDRAALFAGQPHERFDLTWPPA